MREYKFLEIRDRATFIPALAIPICGYDHWLASRAGFGDRKYILLTQLSVSQTHWDPCAWNSRTMSTAHQYIEIKFDSISNGDVIDVEYILGETKTKKQSEQQQHE